jgi:hypothetical protein
MLMNNDNVLLFLYEKLFPQVSNSNYNSAVNLKKPIGESQYSLMTAEGLRMANSAINVKSNQS